MKKLNRALSLINNRSRVGLGLKIPKNIHRKDAALNLKTSSLSFGYPLLSIHPVLQHAETAGMAPLGIETMPPQ